MSKGDIWVQILTQPQVLPDNPLAVHSLQTNLFTGLFDRIMGTVSQPSMGRMGYG